MVLREAAVQGLWPQNAGEVKGFLFVRCVRVVSYFEIFTCAFL